MSPAEQWMTALEVANERRLAVAEYKRGLAGLPLADATRRLADDLDDGHGAVQHARVMQLILSLPGWGNTRLSGLLADTLPHLGEKRRVRDLTGRERELLTAGLRDAADRYARSLRTRRRRVDGGAAVLPIGPFREWLVGEVGDEGLRVWARAHQLPPSSVSSWLCVTPRVRASQVDRVGAAVGRPGLLGELYGGRAAAA